MTTAPLLFADDSSTSEDGKKDDIKMVTVNGKQVPVRVQDVNPYANVKSHPSDDGKYHPDNYSFNTTSSMGNKSFAMPANQFAHADPSFADPTHTAYATKSYSDTIEASPSAYTNSESKDHFPIFAANSRPASGFDQTYATTSTELGHAAAIPATNADPNQNRTATFDTHDKDLDANAQAMANKTYLGPGAQHVSDDLEPKENVVLSRVSDLPSRNMSIDEVRDLINHGIKPDTKAEPGQPSKALNDPDYVPQSLRDDPIPGIPESKPSDSVNHAPAPAVPAIPVDDDKNDPVPSPGSMAAPENSEPLPQR